MKRRWRQFRIRSLLILIVLCASGLAIWDYTIARPYRAQLRAAENLRKLGARVDLAPTEASWLSRLFGDKYFRVANRVVLTGPPFSDAELLHLAALGSVYQLWFQRASVTESGLANLPGSLSLRSMKFDHAPLTDVGLRSLTSSAPELETLELIEADVTNSGLAELEKFSRLRHLSIQDRDITNEGLAHLQNLPGLEQLHICNCSIDGDGLRFLHGSATLKLLNIAHSRRFSTRVMDGLYDRLPGCSIHVSHPPNAGVGGSTEGSKEAPAAAPEPAKKKKSAKAKRPAESVRDGWLSPVELKSASAGGRATGRQPQRRASNLGFLPVTLAEYLRLLDWTGRQIRRVKRGAIPADLAPILERLHVVGEAWVDQVQHFGRWYRRAAGRAASLAEAAAQRGLHWLHGIAHSRTAFS